MKIHLKGKVLLTCSVIFLSMYSQKVSAENWSGSSAVKIQTSISETFLTPVNSFVVVKGQNTQDAVIASKAIAAADMEMYRLRDTRRSLKFKNGVVIELLSAEELKNSGSDINLNAYNEKLPPGYKEPVYLVNPQGLLIQLFEEKTPVKN